jgi:hypothetical protein
MSKLVFDATAVRSLRRPGDKNSNCVAWVWLSGFVEAHVRLFFAKERDINILARRLPRVADDGLDLPLELELELDLEMRGVGVALQSYAVGVRRDLAA